MELERVKPTKKVMGVREERLALQRKSGSEAEMEEIKGLVNRLLRIVEPAGKGKRGKGTPFYIRYCSLYTI